MSIAMDAHLMEPSSSLPEGTVTFLFTDVEGSTKLLKKLGSSYKDLISDYDQIIQAALKRWHGRVVDSRGEEFFATFPKATEAVAAAADIQHAFAKYSWPDGVQVRVRMGLHTGEPWLVEEGYMGMDVHRAARIGNVGHGGQVLLSETTTALVIDDLPDGVSLLDLGRHRLKDMRRPEPIHQLVIEDLPSEFPPLKSLEALPAFHTSSPDAPVAEVPRQVGPSPYRGLAAFREDDAELFFGRDTFIEQMAKAVSKRQLVAVIVGPSGSGKSSAVFAGLLPQLREEDKWLIVESRPGNKPFHAMAAALVPHLEQGIGETELLVESGRLAQAIRAGELSLFHVAKRALDLDANAQRCLLVIDQFEELFTHKADVEIQRLFLDELIATAAAASTQRPSPLVMLLTLRADFMGQALGHRPFADALQEGSLILGPMNREEMQAAVERPAELSGAAFETGLVQRILDDVGDEPGNLPLLEFALTLLWENMEDGWMTHAAYEDIGRVDGALARYAEEVWTELDSEERARARSLFVQLVQPGEGTEDTRRVAKRQELTPGRWSIVQYLADRRLVVTCQDEAGLETVEVVHEALIRSWDRLRQWMQAERAFRTWQEGLRVAMRGWEASDRDDGALLRGVPLALALDWVAEKKTTAEGEAAIGPLELEFIETSIAADREQKERLAQQARMRRNLRRGLIAALSIGLIVALALSIYAFSQQRLAEERRQEALRQASIGLASLAGEEMDGGNQDLAALLALEALEEYPFTSQAAGALARVVDEYRAYRVLDTSGSILELVMVATWSPDGKRIAAGANASPNSLIVWDAATVQVLLSVNVHRDLCHETYSLMRDLAWSPDGLRLAAPAEETESGKSCGVVVIDSQTGERLLILNGSDSPVWSLDWSPDGMALLSGHEDGNARIWDANSGELLSTFKGHRGIVRDAAYSPGGHTIATASEDGTVRLWDVDTTAELSTLSGHVGAVRSLAWSSDASRLVSGGNDGLPRIWDVASGETILVLAGHMDDVVIVTWSADDRRIASQGLDAVVDVWDAVAGGLLYQIPNTAPHARTKRGFVEFSPDGKWILAGGSRVLGPRIWDTSMSVPKMFGHTFGLEWAGWSPDGKLIASSGEDGSARLWDAKTGEQIGEFPKGSYWSDWSPDGAKLVFSEGSGMYRLNVWDVAGGELEAILTVPPDEFGSPQFLTIDWSPDGAFITAAAFRPGTPQPLYIWDARSYELVSTLHSDDLCMLGWPRWSPDSTMVAAGCIFVQSGMNTPARIWDVSTGEERMKLESEDGWTYHTEWSPDGSKILVTYEHGVARIFDTSSGQVLLTFTGHLGQVDGEWSPDGSLIASADYATRVVKIWRSEKGEELFSFSVPGAPLTVGWSPDGQQIIVTGDGFNEPIIKRVWRSPDELIAHAQACCVSRQLTQQERIRFGLPVDQDESPR